MNMKKYVLQSACLLITGALCLSVSLSSCNGGGSSSGSSSDSTQTANSNSDDNTLLGAGSTFIYPFFSKIFSVYNQETGLKINYQSIGSGGGILQLTNKTVDFGDSDAPLNDQQTQKMGAPVLHVPMCSGAVVISYNIPGLTDTLDITPDILAGIYLGKITKWNDPVIKAANKSVKIPDLPIVVTHRSDGSGTTNIFTNYLSKVNDTWKTQVGASTAVDWPVGLGGKGNEGVSGLINQTPGAIGYIELAYAMQNKMLFARMENKSGNFITPNIASTSAAANVQLPADAKAFVTNTDDPEGYPISGFTWVLIYKEQDYNGRSLNRATELLKLLWWNIHQGQQYCQALYYAPLPPSAVQVAENILKSATYNGKPILQ
jgi:phosphate transport system substrate-binding protein